MFKALWLIPRQSVTYTVGVKTLAGTSHFPILSSCFEKSLAAAAVARISILFVFSSPPPTRFFFFFKFSFLNPTSETHRRMRKRKSWQKQISRRCAVERPPFSCGHWVRGSLYLARWVKGLKIAAAAIWWRRRFPGFGAHVNLRANGPSTGGTYSAGCRYQLQPQRHFSYGGASQQN